MSELGEAEGLVATASLFRDMFIRDGIQYGTFKCPFCEIGLCAKAIYIDGVQGKSPHFAVFPRQHHLFDCDGMPATPVKKRTPPTFTYGVEKVDMDVPEDFVVRHERVRRVVTGKSSPALSEEEIRNRRSDPSFTVFTASHTSQLLQSFAEGWIRLASACFAIRDKQSLDPAAFSALFTSTMKAYPLNLVGEKMTYYQAFRDTRWPVPGRHIFKGTGIAKVTEYGIDILCDADAEMRKDSFSQRYPVVVQVRFTPPNGTGLPRSHQSIISQLGVAASEKRKFKWFAVGEMKYVEAARGQYNIIVENLDWVYIKHPSSQAQKKQGSVSN